jgi:hypothetical membrane protein
MRPNGARIAVALAPAGCVMFLLLYAIAATQDPEYTFLDDYLSDLGVGPGAWAFNSALMLTGSMLFLFSVFGMTPLLPARPVYRAGGALLALAGMLLVSVGIFTEDAGDTHLFLSYAFFLIVLASFGVLTVAMYRDRPLGALAFYLTGGLCIVGLTMVLALGANPFTETMAVMLIVVWGFVVPGRLFMGLRHETPTAPVSVP